MQLSGDAALATAVEADTRTLAYKFEVDWNRNGLYDHALSDLTKVVKSMSPARDITGTLPPETTMVEGFQSAQMTVVLGGTRPGDTLPIARLLSPWNTTAPLFGDGRVIVPVRASIGHRTATGTETLVRQFTGQISDLSVNSRSMEVSIACLDPSDALRASINLPLWALEKGTTNNPTSDWRVNSQWVIDYVLRRNGIYMSPPPQTGCIWSATGHGSVIPEIGHMPFLSPQLSKGICTPDDQVYYPGRPGWGLAYGGTPARVPAAFSRATGGFLPRVNNSISFQAQIDFTKIMAVHPTSTGTWISYNSGEFYTGGGNGVNIRMRIARDGRLWADFANGSSTFASIGGPTLAMTGYQDVWCRIDFGATLATSSIKWPGLTVSPVDLSGLDLNQQIWTYPQITFSPSWPMHDVQVCNATGLAAGATIYDAAGWVPQCDLDTGLNNVSGLPLRRGVSSWDLLKEVVGAEYGVIGFDESGRCSFKNRDTVRRQNLTVEKTLSRTKHITDFALSERRGSVRNNITSKIAPRVIGSSASSSSGWELVYRLNDRDAIQFPPGNSTFVVKLDSPSWAEDTSSTTQVSAISGPTGWPPSLPNRATFYAAVRQNDNTIEIPSVTLGIVTLRDAAGLDMIRLNIGNPSNFYGVFATVTGDPALWVAGRKYSQDNETNLYYKRQSSITRYGERTLELPDSEWRQQEVSVGTVSRLLLKDLAKPVPIVSQLQAVGDCRLQLQDTAVLDDSGVLGGPMYTSVVGIQRALTVSSGAVKLTDSLTVRPFSAPGRWILGHSVWGILGQTTKL